MQEEHWYGHSIRESGRRESSRRGNSKRGVRVAKVPKREARDLRLKKENADESITPRYVNIDRTQTRALALRRIDTITRRPR